MTVIEKGLIITLVLCPLIYTMKIPHRINKVQSIVVLEEFSQVNKLAYMFSKEWHERYGA